MSRVSIAELKAILTADTKQYQAAMGQAQGKASSLQGMFGELGKKISAAFTITAVIAGFVKALKSSEGGADKLSFAIDEVKGGLEGFGRLITGVILGNLNNYTTNIWKSAIATRDLKMALDELQDIAASDKLKKSFLESSLQMLRVQIAGATDKNEKARLIQEAINTQKEITQVTLAEIRDRINAYEVYFKQMSGLSTDAANKYFEEFRKIAGNERQIFGVGGAGGQYGLWKQQLESQKERNRLIGEGVDPQLRFTVAAAEMYQEMRNAMKPEEWNQWIGMLADYNNALATGSADLVRLTNALTGAETAINRRTPGGKKMEYAPFEFIGHPRNVKDLKEMANAYSLIADNIGMARIQYELLAKETAEWNETFKNMIGDLVAQVSTDLFDMIAQGEFSLESFGNTILTAMGNFLKQYGAMLVAYGIAQEAFNNNLDPAVKIAAGLAMIAIGAALGAMGAKAGEIVGGGSSGGGGGSGAFQGVFQGATSGFGMGNQVELFATIRNKDIYLSSKKGESEFNRIG
ncbi:MAG: hypothetical protein WC428_07625 [Candidatus Paceibacterota bacterium]|jgi:hypothetical protein